MVSVFSSLIEKYYFCDHGLRNCIINEMPNVFGSIEKIIENIVRNHLLIQEFDIYVGVIPPERLTLLQRKATRQFIFKLPTNSPQRRLSNVSSGNLRAIKDDFPKYVVTMEDIVGPVKEYPGIIHIHLRDFLKTVY